MTPIAQALSAALLHFVWQGLLVAALLGIALYLMKNRSANARYLTSSAALAAQAVLPLVTAWVLYRKPAPSGAAGVFSTAVLPAAAAALPRAAVASLPAIESWALPIWFAGVLIFSIRLAWGCRQISVLRRAGESASPSVEAVAASLRRKLGLFRNVGIVVTRQSDSPSVVGWLRPVILLPAATVMGLSEQQLEAVLAHELAHIRRHDYLVNLLQNLVETLLFYHPAVWWTSARMRHERELCCDDVAVHSCGDPICYARALTILEKMRGASVSLAMGSTGGPLLYRIRRLMGLETRETAPSRVTAAAAVLLGLACLAVNMNWAHAQAQEGLHSVRGVLGYAIAADSPGVQVDLGGAQVSERTGIEYPGQAWEHKIGGIVVVEATLDGQGEVSDARVLSGPAELRKSTLQSVLQWRFAAAPAGTTRQVSVNYQWEQAQNEMEHQPGQVVVMTGAANGRTYNFLVRGKSEQENRVRLLEEQLEDAQKTGEQSRVAELKAKLDQAQKALAEKESLGSSGQRISQIEMSRLTSQQQQQLAGRLPVGIGDNLTELHQMALTKVLAEANPPLKVEYGQDSNNQIVIHIVPANPR